MTYTDYTVRYTVVTGAPAQLATRERSLKTDAARAAFLDKLDNGGTLVEVLALSDPE